MKGRVLIIAGSDPSGGAGLQADIKTVTALGGYAAAAVTALTVQNTQGVRSVHAVDPALIRAQVAAVLEDVGADAIKIGMIGERAAAECIGAILENEAAGIPVVLDPVLVATSGDALAGDGVAGVILERLAPLAAVLTPNSHELAALTGRPVRSPDEMRSAGALLSTRTRAALLLKGGHLEGDEVVDMLVEDGRTTEFRGAKIRTRSTHGTGCTLASALATGMAQGLPLARAADRAIAYVREAIRTAPGYGSGAGPLNHAHPFVQREV